MWITSRYIVGMTTETIDQWEWRSANGRYVYEQVYASREDAERDKARIHHSCVIWDYPILAQVTVTLNVETFESPCVVETS